MKSTQMEFPKFYTEMFEENGQMHLKYISNRYDENGNLSLQDEVLPLEKSMDKDSYLASLNEVQFQKLKVFIKRQEKVVETYKRQQKTEQYNIVNESLQQFYDLKEKFNLWFEGNEA